jgi:hypothetical protein
VRGRLIGIVSLIAALALAGGSPSASASVTGSPVRASASATGALLRPTTGLYPRAIRRSHAGPADGRIVASVVAFAGNSGQGAFYESTDQGATFTQVGAAAPAGSANGGGLCCGSLLELPQQLGDLPAGTLLWAASVGANAPDRRMSLQVWKSADVGRTWSYLSSCAVAANTGGLWEPELSIDGAGRLACYFSDETGQPAHSQVIRRAASSDGVSWSAPVDTVVGATSTLRPGMPTVRQVPGGYLMAYEVCSTDGSYGCAAFLRTSVDGANWGSAANLGTRISTADGRYFAHAPTISWLDNGTANGRLLLVGQMLYNADGTVAPGNGSTILVNTEKGTGGWFEVPAPVSVPAPYANYCPNYSSALLPAVGGASVLEIATSYADDGACKPYFATGSVLGSQAATGITAGKTYRLVDVLSRLCLDVAADSRVAGGNIEQWTCNGLGPQNFVVTSVGGGYFTLKGQNSGMCADVANGSPDAGADVRQWTCNGTSAQAWRIVGVGNGYYTLVSKVSGQCLDVQGGSATAGANVWQWTCNSQSPQIWSFQLRS